ncbi:helix-turn-helix domain-containing protein [uncultured Sulfuricurvum sp.]|uniref:helix-turn-helix domain-containing protein n=1 Tax=uncultured Sulfuricurvum sp. TaxID=430693 RepID=UPI00262795E7|nr:helix-turn-helix domain-containing protein [uncultured Sulfuricurvum sp.]
MATIDLITKSDLIAFQNKIMEQLKTLIQPEKEFITESELITLFDFNKSTLAKMRMNGEIPYYKFGGKLFYKAVEVNRIIERNQVG